MDNMKNLLRWSPAGHRGVFCRPVMAIGAAVTSFAALFGVTTNTWIAGSTDWNSPASYVENAKPGSADCVLIPRGVNAIVSVSTDDAGSIASFNAFSNVVAVLLEDSTSCVTIDIGEGLSLTNGCKIYGMASGKGKIVKKGAGCLEFGAQASLGYDVDIDVESGVLVFPQEIESGSFFARVVTVAEGATLVTAADAARRTALAAAPTELMELWGGGVVSNRYSAKRLTMRSDGRVSTFAGVLGRGIRLFPDVGATLNLTGEASTMSSDPAVTAGAIINFMKMGMSGEVSSLGVSDTLSWRGSGTFCYLGNGETSDRDLMAWTTADVPLVFDGGPNGGLTLTGSISCYVSGGKDSAGMQRLELTGSNTVPCVVAGPMPTWTIFETNYNFHVIKSGTGTWRFADVARTHAGGFTVKEGALQYDSLKDRGSTCSLGTATNTMECYSGLIDESKRVDWAFALGAADTAGKFEYTGSKNVWCYTRPILMRGNGTVSVTNGNVRFRFANVSADDGVDATLTLSGSNTKECSLVNATDGEGTLSIAKDGPGTWYLEGENSFSGSLSVKAGTLVVRNPEDYSWWRWTVQQTYAEHTDKYAQLQEVCLFDEDGNRVNGGLQQVSGQTAYENLEPGYAAYHKYGELGGFYLIRPLKNLFDDGKSDTNPGNGWVFAWYTNGVQVARPMLDDPSTWIPVIMRLPEGAARVASYDLVHLGAKTSARNVDAFRWEGSVDGVNWHVLTNVAGAQSAGQNKWLFTRDAYTAGSAATHTGGKPLRGGPETSANPLAGVSSVSVSPGAVLRAEGPVTIPALSVDAGGAGTIDGFAFAETGALSVSGLPETGSVTLPVTFENCTGLDNVADWVLTVDGETSGKISAAVRNNQLLILRKGLAVVIR